MAVELTKQEEAIFEAARKGDYNTFTSFYFRLPYSGTWFTPEDRVEEYSRLHEYWTNLGKPMEEMEILLDNKMAKLKIVWGDYGREPAILLPHGYLLLPWAFEMLSCGRPIVVAEGGTGSAKTSSVGIVNLTKCAIYPGFDFLNVGPTNNQSLDMMEEVAKWSTGTPFEKFIVFTPQKQLWKYRPIPTMTIDCGLDTYSTFQCMTVGVHGNFILGKGKDSINVDEASLVLDIDEAIPPMITRVRGSRRNGRPRSSVPALSFITNPHDNNPSFDLLKERAIEEMKQPEGDLYFVRPKQNENIYITERQKQVQRSMLDAAQQRRWLDGSDEDLKVLGVIPIILLTENHDPSLDVLIENLRNEGGIVEDREGMGVIRYELPYEEGREYLVWGDPGRGNAVSLRVNNVPTAGVWDITGFPEAPATLVAMWMMDGNGFYTPWISAMKYYMAHYRGIGCYDASGIGMAFVEWPDIERYPLFPVTLSGNNKATGRTFFLLFAGEKLFRWPHIKALWHQARSYRETGPGLQSLPDDLIAGMFVSSFYLRFQFWRRLSELFHLEEKTTKPGAVPAEKPDAITRGRYQRRGRRYVRKANPAHRRKAD